VPLALRNREMTRLPATRYRAFNLELRAESTCDQIAKRTMEPGGMVDKKDGTSWSDSNDRLSVVPRYVLHGDQGLWPCGFPSCPVRWLCRAEDLIFCNLTPSEVTV
jgi:hypothetical protein